jgi:hypothetical protein
VFGFNLLAVCEFNQLILEYDSLEKFPSRIKHYHSMYKSRMNLIKATVPMAFNEDGQKVLHNLWL